MNQLPEPDDKTALAIVKAWQESKIYIGKLADVAGMVEGSQITNRLVATGAYGFALDSQMKLEKLAKQMNVILE